jgi:hypothetical protein
MGTTPPRVGFVAVGHSDSGRGGTGGDVRRRWQISTDGGGCAPQLRLGFGGDFSLRAIEEVRGGWQVVVRQGGDDTAVGRRGRRGRFASEGGWEVEARDEGDEGGTGSRGGRRVSGWMLPLVTR